VTIAEITALFNARQAGPGRWRARCPAHDDRSPSLSISEGANGRILLNCFARCDLSEIVHAIGIQISDLFSDEPHGVSPRATIRNSRSVVASFTYTASDGTPEARVDRVEPGRDGRAKEFFPYLWDANTGSFAEKAGLEGKGLPLYHLDEVRRAIASGEEIYFVEGEGKADGLRAALREAGSSSAVTTISGGANAQIRPDHVASLAGAAKVVVISDSDKPGIRAASARGTAIASAYASADVRTVNLYPGREDGSDIADWLQEGHTLLELRAATESAPRVDSTMTILSSSPADRKANVATFVRASDLIAESDGDELECVIEDMLPVGGTAILAGRPKGGKSTLALNLALNTARGEAFMGREVRRGAVLYLALEGANGGWKQLLRRLGVGKSDDLYLCIDRAPDDMLRWLREAIEEYHPVLVIIDTLQRLLRVRDGNDYATGSNATDAVIELARRSGAAVMLLHHSGKTRHADIVDDVMGSTAWAASVDTVMVLRKSEHHRTIASEQRFGRNLEETVLEMQADTNRVSAGGSKREADLTRARDAIVAFLQMHAEEHAEEHIVDERTIDKNVEGRTMVKREALRDLVASADIGRVGSGRKGDPYGYSIIVPLVPAPTRERENEKGEPINLTPTARAIREEIFAGPVGRLFASDVES
jgi:hypothetical protein